LIAINKTNMDLYIMSAESTYQTNIFDKWSVSFKATVAGTSTQLAFTFGNWTGAEKADLFVR
jgi:hypothetical protein